MLPPIPCPARRRERHACTKSATTSDAVQVLCHGASALGAAGLMADAPCGPHAHVRAHKRAEVTASCACLTIQRGRRAPHRRARSARLRTRRRAPASEDFPCTIPRSSSMTDGACGRPAASARARWPRWPSAIAASAVSVPLFRGDRTRRRVRLRTAGAGRQRPRAMSAGDPWLVRMPRAAAPGGAGGALLVPCCWARARACRPIRPAHVGPGGAPRRGSFDVL